MTHYKMKVEKKYKCIKGVTIAADYIWENMLSRTGREYARTVRKRIALQKTWIDDCKHVFIFLVYHLRSN